MEGITWIAIIVFIAIIIVTFIALQIVMYFLLKSNMKKAFASLDNLVPIEKERFNKIKDIYNQLLKLNRINNEEIKELVAIQENNLNLERLDMQIFKGNNDFLIMYLLRLLKEKKLKLKEPFCLMNETLESISYFESKDKDTPYYKYNKIANRYNTFASMSLVSKTFKKASYPRVPIL